jgi:hypothetical protein
MDTYMVGTCLLMVLLVLYELLLVFIQGKAVFETAFFMESLLAVMVIWLFLIAYGSFGSLVNNQHALHRYQSAYYISLNYPPTTFAQTMTKHTTFNNHIPKL